MLPLFCFSQTVTTTAGLVTPLSALGASARADGMGSAFTGVADDPSALFFNAAGLSGLPNARLSLNHNSYLGGSFEETFLVGLPAGDLGGFSGAIQYVLWGGLEARDANGVLLGTFDDNDLALSIGWGREFGKGFSLGAALHGTQQKVVNSLYTGLTGDLGLLWTPLPDLKLGLVYAGFGPGVSGQTPASDLKGGASCLLRLEQDKTLLLAFSGSYEPNGVSRLQGGIEAGYRKNFFLRAGYQQPLSDNQVGGFQNFTAGAGIHIDSLVLDYAYVPYGDLGTSHRVSVGYEFPNPTSVISKPVTVQAPPVTVVAPPAPMSVPPSGPPKSKVEVHFELPGSTGTPKVDAQASTLVGPYEKAAEENPGNSLAWRNLGIIYLKTGQTALGIQCLEQALHLNPNDQVLEKWFEEYRAKHPDKP